MALKLIFLTLLCCGRQVFSQTGVSDAAEGSPKVALRVLESVEVKRGDHSIIYQRVAPPSPGAIPQFKAPVVEQVPSSMPLTESPQAEKQHRSLAVSATIYDGGVTELRWWNRSAESVIFSNLDFRFLEGITEIETEHAVWLLFMSIRDASREAAVPSEAILKARSLDPRQAQYFVILDSVASVPDEETLAAIGALHRFYGENRARLVAERASREVERALAQQALKEHPPIQKDTIIQFWPQKSRVYSTTGK